MPFSRRLTLIAAASFVALFASAAAAQVDHLNVDRLIRGLRERGMLELLEHMAQSDEWLKNEADRKKLNIEMNILQANRLAQSPDTRDQATAKLMEGIDGFKNLIEANRDAVRRPQWQADMAIHLLFDLPQFHLHASAFYEFGVPTVEQREAFESAAHTALEQLVDADSYLGLLETRLPREDPKTFQQMYVNTGRWDEMINEYRRTRIPFLTAEAAYDVALLPDDHPYYKSLRNNRYILTQASTPAEERTRLLNQVIDELDGIEQSLRDKYGLPAGPIELLRGKALVRLGDYEKGMPILEKLATAEETKNTIVGFQADLMRGWALYHQTKPRQTAAAMQHLAGVKDHRLASGQTGNPLFRVLIADLEHRLLMKYAAEQKNTPELIDAAYKPYDELLGDKRLGPNLELTRIYVYKRWIALNEGVDRSKLHPLVLAGMGEMERIEGQQIAARAYGELQGGNESAYNELIVDARRHLTNAQAVADELIRRDDVSAEVKARARYNKAWAILLGNYTSPRHHLQAADVWTDLAVASPEHPLAEESIARAITFVHNLHVREGEPAPELVEQYKKTGGVLMDKFADTEASMDERLYYTFTVLQGERKWAEAVDSYSKIPPSHKDYIKARAEMLFCLYQQYEDMKDGDQRDSERRELLTLAKEIKRQAFDAEREAPTQEQRKTIAQSTGYVTLTEVDLLMDASNWPDAHTTLKRFIEDHQNDPALLREANSKMIVVKVRSNEPQEAVAIAEKMMEAAGDDEEQLNQTIGTIDYVLTEISNEIDELRYRADVTESDLQRNDMLTKAMRLAKAADTLADMLLTWAQGKGFNDQQMFRYRMIKLRSLMLIEEFDKANVMLKRLKEKFSDEPQVVYLEGVLLFETEDYRKAIQVLNRLVNSIRPVMITPQMPLAQRQEQELLNNLWWRGWLRILQCYDRMDVQVAQIPRFVTNLQQQFDGYLGPRDVETKLRELQLKHRQ